jgi:hypothetical protein
MGQEEVKRAIDHLIYGGLAMVAAGIAAQYGWPYAAMVAGGFLIAIGLALSRRL